MLGLISCSTRKNRWGNRFYHSTTTYYNGYFNGVEALKEGVNTLSAANVDDYYRILKVYPTGNLDNGKTIQPYSDKAIAKASMVIKKHSMYIKGRERNKYIDDAYLLIGQAYLYKRDYYAAIEMFNYASRESIKNHRRDQITHISRAWLARAYSELGMFDDAYSALEPSLNDKNLKGRARGFVFTVLTDHYLKQNNYSRALESVREAIKETREKSSKRRLIFISGQLMQKSGLQKNAYEQFKRVLKMTPPYEMAFYARINIARCYQAESGNSREIRALLNKMLKDSKNLEYADQIYYSLGEIEEKDAFPDKAIEQYNKSVRISSVNTNQKGLSYLGIANILFHQQKYRYSAVYYDSAVSFLSKEHPEFKQTENLKNSLADLVRKYETITLYDSLLKLSELSKEDIDKKIEEQIAADEKRIQKQKEDQKKREQMQNQQQMGASGSSTGGALGGIGQWYFFNPTTKSFGYTEFRRVWGDRPLEDNWRRSNKQALANVPGSEESDKQELAKPDSVSKISTSDSLAAVRKKYFEAIPASLDMKMAYKDSVSLALYELGIIYKDRLGDLKQAAEVFSSFLKKFPAHKFEPTVLYQLYRIYLSIPDSSIAESFKTKLLSDYPDSEYSRIIKDPDFFKTGQLSKQEAEIFYGESYRLFKAGQYAEALARCRKAEVKYPGNILMPKFALLKALCMGALKDIQGYRSALEDVIKNYSGDPVKAKAQEFLSGVNQFQGIIQSDSVIKEKPHFIYRADTSHYYIVLFADKSKNLNDFKIALSDFNMQYYSADSLIISSRFLGSDYQMVQVQNFSNKAEADQYMKSAESDDVLFSAEDMNIIDSFIISAENYLILIRETRIKEYLDFFKRVYQ